MEHNRGFELMKEAAKIGHDARSAFYPLGALVSIAIQVGRQFIGMKVSKAGSTIYTDKLENYAELLMLLEMGIAEFDFTNHAMEVYLENIPRVTNDTNEQERIRQQLLSENKQDQRDAFFHLLSLNVYRQRGTLLLEADQMRLLRRKLREIKHGFVL